MAKEREKAFQNFKERVDQIEKALRDTHDRHSVKGTAKKKSGRKAAQQSASQTAVKERSENSALFGMLCQQIMSDINMQNQGRKSIPSYWKSSRQSGADKKIYQHFSMLLYQCIRDAFFTYVREEFDFLFSPLCRPDWTKQHSVEAFLDSGKLPQVGIYDELREVMGKDDRAVDWYITAHFIPAKQLNLLAGDFRSYKQYIYNVDDRSASTDNRKDSQVTEKLRHYEKILSVIEFVLLFSGRISHEATDSFPDEKRYAEYLSHFVDFQGKDKDSLLAFCATKYEKSKATDHAIGIYTDGEGNAILNKNIVYSLLYGDEKKMAACMEKVTLKEIQKYYDLADELEKVFQRGGCESEEEQKKLKEYQNLKNRIELLDVMTFAEMLNDFMGQMISWAYLRERDLMYFQLGYHYVRLYDTGTVPAESRFRTLQGEQVNIVDGALLYQIIAMYDYSRTVFKVDDNGNAVPADSQGTVGASLKSFVKEYCRETMQTAPTYEGGMSFFEDLARHDEFADFRKNIAHMKYLIRADLNIWEMFSKVYNGFFIYDTKLKKSVSYILLNILERYFVVADTRMSHQDEAGDGALLQLGEKGLSSDKLTYKLLNSDKKVIVDARSEIFLEQLKGLLEYSER